MEQLVFRLYDGDKMLSCNHLAECLNTWRAKWFNGDNITVEVRIKGIKQTMFIPLFKDTDKAAYGDNSNVKPKHLTVARQWVYGKKFRKSLLKHLFALNGTYDMRKVILRARIEMNTLEAINMAHKAMVIE